MSTPALLAQNWVNLYTVSMQLTCQTACSIPPACCRSTEATCYHVQATKRAGWMVAGSTDVHLCMQALTSLPTWQDGTLPGRVVIDIANEPSLFSIKWNRTSTFNGVQFPSWPTLYTAATEACPRLQQLLSVIAAAFERLASGTASSDPAHAASDPHISTCSSCSLHVLAHLQLYSCSHSEQLPDSTTASP